MSRLKERYSKDVAPALAKEFGYKNVMAIPKIEKVVVNMGLGEATGNAKIVDTGADEVSRITGQKAVITRSIVISDRVSVPVLSEQITEAEPSVSTEESFLTMALRFANRCTPSASTTDRIAGRPSGTAASSSKASSGSGSSS